MIVNEDVVPEHSVYSARHCATVTKPPEEFGPWHPKVNGASLWM